MARHESEMHRQRNILADALRQIAVIAERGESLNPVTLATWCRSALFQANINERNCGPLFADHSQMDLQDRKDI